MQAQARFIKIFIDNEEPTVNVCSELGRTATPICSYRVNASSEELELYVENEDKTVTVIAAEEACKLALHDFFFKPFPVPYAL